MGKTHFLREVDKSWTLFLDRDGVINKRIIGGYVKSIRDFEFLPGVLEAIYTFSSYFDKIVVVTNQQGIGKGLYTEEDLNKVHSYLLYEVDQAYAQIDAVFYCPHMAGTCQCRKPEIGMAINAQIQYPQIDFKKSIMVGDSDSDIGFAHKAGMHSVRIVGKDSPKIKNPSIPDIKVPSLLDFAKLLKSYH